MKYPLKSIWQRYFFCELMKVLILFIFCFYFLFVLIDYSLHAKVLQNEQIGLLDLSLYYAYQFTKRCDILIPIALMIGSIKVLITSNLRGEILALTTGGISYKKIVRIFLLAAFFCAAFLYINFQFLQPFALAQITSFEEQYFKEHGRARKVHQVNALILEDNTCLIYQSYDPDKRAFFDVYWLKNCNECYRAQSLLPYEKVPLGKYVDLLIRNKKGEIIKTASYDHYTFPTMKFDTKALFMAVHPPRNQSILQLAHSLGWGQTYFGLRHMNDREAQAATFFYYKLTMPFICILVVLGVAPYCLRFSRNLAVYLIYALSLFGVMILFTVINSFLILGESQIIPPICACIIPQVVLGLFVGYKYAKL